MVPTGTGKTEETRRFFPVRELYSKYWKNKEFNEQSWEVRMFIVYLSTIIISLATLGILIFINTVLSATAKRKRLPSTSPN